MMRILATIIVLVSISGLVLAGIARYQLTRPVSESGLFEIPAGDNLSSITARLEERAFLPAGARLFKIAALLTRDEGAIQAGQYQVESGMDAFDLLALFRSGKVVQYRITFPEGWTYRQWRVHLQEAPYLSSISSLMTDDQIAVALGIDGNIEGYLFPDTYQYISGDTDLEIMQMAARRMQEVLAREWGGRVPVSSIATPHEALVLASIVEKETGIEADREPVASVFINRLERGMKLQSDPTVIYGLGDAFEGDLKRNHLATDTPYNTYTRKGLPPSPICSPGLSSIRAALGGSVHPWLYFVARGDGSSQFSMTLEEHNRAVNRYQKNPARNN